MPGEELQADIEGRMTELRLHLATGTRPDRDEIYTLMRSMRRWSREVRDLRGLAGQETPEELPGNVVRLFQ